jgi:hypothetical protein
MKVVVPDKTKDKIAEALTELYLLRKGIESGFLEDSKKIIKKIDKIRNILQD